MTQLTGVGWSASTIHTKYNLLQENDHYISHKMNSWPHRWTTTHLTGRPSSTSKVDYDMTPKRMVTKYLNGDTAHRILGND